jgi:hypothetical protein
MLFHVSISALNPERVARAIAELWDGAAMPFPPLGEGAWVAHANDDRNTLVEVLARGTELFPGAGSGDAVGVVNPHAPRATATHIAIATPHDLDRVCAIAARHGWLTKYCKRGDAFGVIELWVENAVLIEVLTPEMQAEYRANATLAACRAMFEARELEPA